MMYFIATNTHATTTSHRSSGTRMALRACEGKRKGERERERAPAKNTFNNACHTIVCSFICLSACSYARSFARQLARSLIRLFFVFGGFIHHFIRSCVLFLCVCVCMAPLLSLDTLLVVVISFYHYVNSKSKWEWARRELICRSYSRSPSTSTCAVWRNKIAGLSLWNSWSCVLIKLKRALQNSC